MLISFAHAQNSQFVFDASGNLLLQAMEVSAPPQIISQPQPQVAKPGARVSFFVVAADSFGLTYQWRFNGANMGEATSDTLLLTNLVPTQEGQYSVVLVNSSGSVTSAPAALLLDGDGDGLPDSWELGFFGSLANAPTGDFDGDGVSNANEFLDGTSPNDSASARFRLTVLSDGGSISVSPLKPSYTNGEVVTLIAAAIAPGTFHGWSGDAQTTNNALTLVMSTNRTVFAHVYFYDIAWTNSAGGDWNVAANWSPNFVPGTNDNVFLPIGATITLNTDVQCQSLSRGPTGSPTLTGSGSLLVGTLNLVGTTLGGALAVTVTDSMTWSSGTMSGSGRTVILPGATLTIVSLSTVNLAGGRTLENGGTTFWTSGAFGINAAVITNRVGALFEAYSDAALNPSGLPGSRFDNAGTFRKSVGTGRTTVLNGMAFNNFGLVEIETGVLSLAGGGTHTGVLEVAPGASIDLAGGTHSAGASSTFTGNGDFIVSGGTANLSGLVSITGNHLFDAGTANLTGHYVSTNNIMNFTGGTANFNGTGAVAPTVLNLNGVLGGNQAVTVSGQMDWTGGTMTGNGRTTILPGATLNIVTASSVNLAGGRTLENGGTVLWMNGNFGLSSAIITNRAAALFETRSDADLNFAAMSDSRFDNAGTFRKTVGIGTTAIFSGMAFNNFGIVDIESGILAPAGGYFSANNALLKSAIAGTVAGTEYGRLQISGAVNLNGVLDIDFINGFIPATNDSFALVTASTRNGAFVGFFYPSNIVTMELTNTPTSVIARATAVTPPLPPGPVLRTEVSGNDVRLTWSTVSNNTYRVEYKANLTVTNWSALAGDVTSLSNSASKLDTFTSSNRFYRVRLVP